MPDLDGLPSTICGPMLAGATTQSESDRTRVSLRKSPERPGPQLAICYRTLSEITESVSARNRRIEELEQSHRRVAKTVLMEVLDLAGEIALAVDQFRQSVAAIARATGIEVRRAQRIYKLAKIAEEIRQHVLRCEAENGEGYQYPSWKHFVPTSMTPSAIADASMPVRLSHGTGKDALDNSENSTEESSNKLFITESEYDRLKAESMVKTLKIAELEARLKRTSYGIYGRGNQEEETPQWLFDHFDRQFHFTCDAAASATNHKHPNYFDKHRDGLAQQWDGVVWLNPPFNDIERWLLKAAESAKRGCTVVVLVPLWTKMNWFQTIAIHAQVRLLSRRPRFVGHSGEPPFDCVVLLFNGTSEYRDGRLHVTIENVDDPTRIRSQRRLRHGQGPKPDASS